MEAPPELVQLIVTCGNEVRISKAEGRDIAAPLQKLLDAKAKYKEITGTDYYPPGHKPQRKRKSKKKKKKHKQNQSEKKGNEATAATTTRQRTDAEFERQVEAYTAELEREMNKNNNKKSMDPLLPSPSSSSSSSSNTPQSSHTPKLSEEHIIAELRDLIPQEVIDQIRTLQILILT